MRTRETRMSLAAGENRLGQDREALRGRTVAVEEDIAAK